MEQNKYDQLEMSKIMGQPLDPKKPYSKLVDAICETDTGMPEDYDYVFDVLPETDMISIITSTGVVSQVSVAGDTPAALTYIDVATPEYYIKFTEYLSRKEDILKRKKITINRSLDAYENYEVVQLLASAANSSSHQHTLASGYSRFTYADLVDMIEDVQDYGDNFVLVVGSQVDKDIRLWNWNDNKYNDLEQAFTALKITKIRLGLGSGAQTFSYDDAGDFSYTTTNVLAANKAYLVAVDSEVGKPVLFVRKKLDSVKMLGGVITEDGTSPERIVIFGSAPQTVAGSTGTRVLSISMTGFEEIAGAVKNCYCVSEFTRS